MFPLDATLRVMEKRHQLAELARRPTPRRREGFEGLQKDWDAGNYRTGRMTFLDRTAEGVLDTIVFEFDPALHVSGVSPVVTHYDHLPPNAQVRHLDAYLKAIADGYKPRSVTHALPAPSE